MTQDKSGIRRKGISLLKVLIKEEKTGVSRTKVSQSYPATPIPRCFIGLPV